MPQGNWKCSQCGGTITELPFTPRSDSGLTCRTCYAKGKNGAKPTESSEPMMTVASEAPDFPFDAPLASEPAHGDDLGLGESPMSTEKPKVEGSWVCSSCGGSIASLPFTPRNTSNLKCLDCFKRSKQ
ncbi:hypothetical protein K2Q16_02415 [Patescibacteria group bacterium]|nr:hypothetical protein [Patescibacteria group bacterium]